VAIPLQRPRRKRSEDLDVITVSADDVLKLLDACADWQEFLCVTTAVYLGARRAALARVRRGDVDLVQGTIRFLEKGGKVATKPLPDEYLAILLAAERDGLWSGADDYLIPNRRPASVRRVERSDKVIWEGVKASRRPSRGSLSRPRAPGGLRGPVRRGASRPGDRAEGAHGPPADRDDTRLPAPKGQGKGDGVRSGSVVGTIHTKFSPR
jgi:hypothetical protein